MSGEPELTRAEPGAEPAVPPRERLRVPARGRLVALLSGGIAAVLAVTLAVVVPRLGAEPASEQSRVPVQWQRPTVAAEDLPQTLGIRLTELAVTGAGGLLDLRFQVEDPELAAGIHDAETPPAIVDESTGLLIDGLLMGHSHSGPFKRAVTYYLVFESTGNWVHRGSRVTVLLGNTQVEHVVVV